MNFYIAVSSSALLQIPHKQYNFTLCYIHSTPVKLCKNNHSCILASRLYSQPLALDNPQIPTNHTTLNHFYPHLLNIPLVSLKTPYILNNHNDILYPCPNPRLISNQLLFSLLIFTNALLLTYKLLLPLPLASLFYQRSHILIPNLKMPCAPCALFKVPSQPLISGQTLGLHNFPLSQNQTVLSDYPINYSPYTIYQNLLYTFTTTIGKLIRL